MCYIVTADWDYEDSHINAKLALHNTLKVQYLPFFISINTTNRNDHLNLLHFQTEATKTQEKKDIIWPKLIPQV